MATKKPAVSKWRNATTAVEDLPPNEQLAHQIVSQHADLAPSVDRIMEAELDDDGRLRALEAFHESLSNIGDPNRDPRVAIASAERPASKRRTA